MFHLRLAFTLVPLVVLATAPSAVGKPWWLGYHSSWAVYPESVGYRYVWHGKPANRWLEDGQLFIDSREPYGYYGYYQLFPTGDFGPGPNEEFVMRWRMKVIEEPLIYGDSSVGVTSPEGHAVGFRFEEDRVWVSNGRLYSIPFARGLFHEYEMRSTDLKRFRLYLDAKLVAEDVIGYTGGQPRIGWGDGGSPRGFATWTDFEVGVLPYKVSRGAFASDLGSTGVAPEPSALASLSIWFFLSKRRTT